MVQESIQECLRDLIRGSLSRSARELYAKLSSWLEMGVRSAWRRSFVDLFDLSELDEVVGAAQLELLKSLPGFRGDDERSLRAFTARVGQRAMSHQAHLRLREIGALREERVRLAAEPWAWEPARASRLEADIPIPLSEDDQRFIRGLLRARTQGELAQELGLSMGRISQIKRRVFDRVRELDGEGRELVAAWLLEGAPARQAA